MTDDTIYIAIAGDEFSKILTLAAQSHPEVINYGEVVSAEQVARQWLTEHGDKIDVGRIDASDVAMVGQMWWVPDAT